MVSRWLFIAVGPAFLFIVLFVMWSSIVQAAEPLPLPEPSRTISAPQFLEFASVDIAPAAHSCADILKKDFYKTEEKINSIRAYHQCRAGKVLEQMAVENGRQN
jgi:hypothetical protein